MKKITADEFHNMIRKNPSVFEHWNTPLEITEFVICNNSDITHLSPLLTFSGRDQGGEVAAFHSCHKLKMATGTFHGFVRFPTCGIEKIENLIITQPTMANAAASFWCCYALKIATGNYPGHVDFWGSGIESIQNLHIKNPTKKNDYANFACCKNLSNLEGWDLSKQICIEPEKLAAEKERRALQKFHKETTPKELPFL
jgi:hypothetical protein